MFAPQKFTLNQVRWWGGWADSEGQDVIMRYLLTELNKLESYHGNALHPLSHIRIRDEEDQVRPPTSLTPAEDTSAIMRMLRDLGVSVASLRPPATVQASRLDPGTGRPTRQEGELHPLIKIPSVRCFDDIKNQWERGVPTAKDACSSPIPSFPEPAHPHPSLRPLWSKWSKWSKWSILTVEIGSYRTRITHSYPYESVP